jgi:hypothetical protein
MKIFLLLVVMVGCFVLYRLQTQPKPAPVAVATPVPATPVPTPKKATPMPAIAGQKPGTAPLTRSSEIQKGRGLQGTSLDQPARK